MDHIDEVLTTGATTQKFSPAVKAALSMGKLTLNRYYSKTDDSDIYRVAMGMCFSTGYLTSTETCIDLVLHPGNKTHYFNVLGWEQEWIEAAVQIVRERWNEKYKTMALKGRREDPSTVCS